MSLLTLGNIFRDMYDNKRTDQWQLPMLSERTRLALLSFLQILVLGTLIFTLVNTVQALRSFQQQYHAVKTGDVSAVSPWMTVHVVSQVYSVPESYLCDSLQVGNAHQLRHVTIYEIAKRKRQPVKQVITTIQHAILVYRKRHPGSATPTPIPRSIPMLRMLSKQPSTPGRTSL